MKNNMNIDWFDKLKFEIIDLSLFFKMLEIQTVFVLNTNGWILEDINLFERLEHLKEMLCKSNNDLNEFVKRISLLDSNLILFDKSDLIDEFDFIKENINLESNFLTNIVNYITIVNNPSINDFGIIERLEQYQEIDISCYNQMKINNEELKKLRKERRDLF